MNKLVRSIKSLDVASLEELLNKEPKWLTWVDSDGKNALHYLCGVEIAKTPMKAGDSLQMLRLLLEKGMDINSVQRIPCECGDFPATPLWYAYTRGRNEMLFNYLLEKGADPEHCMYAIAWYDDSESAALFKKYGATIDDTSAGDTPFMAAFNWKRFNVAEWFLKNGADVNFADKAGNTTLFYAVKRKLKPEYIKLLLQFGADFTIENKEGVSPEKLAIKNKQKGILDQFKTS